MIKNIIVLLTLTIALSGCLDNEPKIEGRWYTQAQVDQGQEIYTTNCAVCHGSAAQGTKEWNKPLPDGKYPPPPLNGTAHAWHHPLKGLKTSIREGGVKLGGSMPAFKDKLSEDQQEAVIAFFQNKWPSQIYNAWLERGGLR